MRPCIEWLFEAERFEENPIWTDGGVTRIRALAEEHGVDIRSVCADYFMAHPFFRVPETERRRSVDVLRRLVERAAAVGVRVVLVPVLEISEIRTPDEEETLAAALEECLPAARACGVRLGLETELEAPAYAAFAERFGGASVGVYYHIGNEAACGYDQERDLERLGLLVCGVHVKDRPLGGVNVPLGCGAADIPGALAALVRAGGVLLTQIHELDIAHWLYGMAERVFALGEHWTNLEIDVEGVASLLLECRYGGRPLPVHLQEDYVRRPPVRSCEAVGERGVITDREDVRRFEGFERSQMFLDEVKDFLGALRGEHPPAVDLREGLSSLRLALAAHRSIDSGQAEAP